MMEREKRLQEEEIWRKMQSKWGSKGSLELIEMVERTLPLRQIIRSPLMRLYPEVEHIKSHRYWLHLARIQTSQRCYFWPWLITSARWQQLNNNQTEQFLEKYVTSQLFSLQKIVAKHFLSHGYNPTLWLQQNSLPLQIYHDCLIGMVELSYRCLQYYLRKNGRRTMSYRTSQQTEVMRAPLINGQHWLDAKDWQMWVKIIKYAHQIEICSEEPNCMFQLRITLIQQYKYARKDESIALKKMRIYEEGWLPEVQQVLLTMLAEQYTIPQICLQLIRTFPQYPALGDKETVRKFIFNLMKQQLIRLQRGEIWKQFRVDLRINSYQIKCISIAKESKEIRGMLAWTILNPEYYGGIARKVIPLLKKYLTDITRF